MPSRLSREEKVTIEVLAEKGQNHCQIARTLGVTEGTVRYHLRRVGEGRQDGRRNKPFQVQAWAEVIEHWVEGHQGSTRPMNVRALHEHLVYEWGYEGSYRSVLRYVRRRYGYPQVRTYRRVETPPGAQCQTDWVEFPRLDVGEGPEPLSALVMVLSHSRMLAIVWSSTKDQSQPGVQASGRDPSGEPDHGRQDGDRQGGWLSRGAHPHLPGVRKSGGVSCGRPSSWLSLIHI